MDGANHTAFKMHQVINYVLNIRSPRWKLEPKGSKKKPWSIFLFSICDFSGDTVTRRNVNGFILYVLVMSFSWQSKGKRSMNLSSSEAFSKAIKEIIFAVKSLQSISLSIGNVDVIFMIGDITATNHINNVDVKYKYVNKYVANEILEIVFVQSAVNKVNMRNT